MATVTYSSLTLAKVFEELGIDAHLIKFIPAPEKLSDYLLTKRERRLERSFGKYYG